MDSSDDYTHSNHLFLRKMQITVTLTEATFFIFFLFGVKNCWHGWGLKPQT